jgi:hypothetical protein
MHTSSCTAALLCVLLVVCVMMNFGGTVFWDRLSVCCHKCGQVKCLKLAKEIKFYISNLGLQYLNYCWGVIISKDELTT